MKKTILILLGLFMFLCLLFILFFGSVKLTNNASLKSYKYENSPFYNDILRKNDSVIYLNVWGSYNIDSFERYQELIKDKNKIVYNISLDKDSNVIKKEIEKFRIKNDISLKNYFYKEEILKNIYNSNFTAGTDFIYIKFSQYEIPKTFVFDKQVLKKKF
jgi:hypothetical protein